MMNTNYSPKSTEELVFADNVYGSSPEFLYKNLKAYAEFVDSENPVNKTMFIRTARKTLPKIKYQSNKRN